MSRDKAFEALAKEWAEAGEDVGIYKREAADVLRAILAAPDEKPKLRSMMTSIASGYPLSMEYETDARDVWPERWKALMDQYGDTHPDETAGLGEGQRQLVLLAIAELALSRPGWDNALLDIAAKYNGSEMYVGFKETSKDIVRPVLTPAAPQAPTKGLREAIHDIIIRGAFQAGVRKEYQYDCHWDADEILGLDFFTRLSSPDTLREALEVLEASQDWSIYRDSEKRTMAFRAGYRHALTSAAPQTQDQVPTGKPLTTTQALQVAREIRETAELARAEPDDDSIAPQAQGREAERDAVINEALTRIAFLTDSGDYHGYRSEVWIAVAKVYDTGHSAPPAAKSAEPKAEIRRNPDGSLDEIVACGQIHVEQLDTGQWWIGIKQGNGERIALTLSARGTIKAVVTEELAAKPPDSASTESGETRKGLREISQDLRCTQCGMMSRVGFGSSLLDFGKQGYFHWTASNHKCGPVRPVEGGKG